MHTRLTRIWVFVWLWSRSRESKTRVEDMKVYPGAPLTPRTYHLKENARSIDGTPTPLRDIAN